MIQQLNEENNWREKIKSVCTAILPFAFTVDGKRVPPDVELLNDSIDYVLTEVMAAMKKAYMAGWLGNAVLKNEGATWQEEMRLTEEHYAEREFNKWISHG